MQTIRDLIDMAEPRTMGRRPSRPFIPPGFSYYPTGKRCSCEDCTGKWLYLKDGLCQKHAEPEKPKRRKPVTHETTLRKRRKRARERARLRLIGAN